MSQLETWDPKPEAPAEVRGSYASIATSTPGISLGEGLPLLAQRIDRLALLRAVSHQARDHRQAAYMALTGRPPIGLNGLMVADPVPPSRDDPPCLGAMIARVAPPPRDVPSSVVLPYQIAERGLVAGQNAGFLGPAFDPVVVRPQAAQAYEGLSPFSSQPHVEFAEGLTAERLRARAQLLDALQGRGAHETDDGARQYAQMQQAAMDIMTSNRFSKALDLSLEPPESLAAYGDHLCGKSALTARRLTEAGVPLVTVFCAAGDLNGSFGGHWDHHFQIFDRLKQHMMPPLDQASAALLDDLAARNTLDETLVVWLTEFGRSPTLSSLSGRDHWPDCFSIALAGAGIAGGMVYGQSDKLSAAPQGQACQPEDVHATIFHALGIDPVQSIPGPAGRQHPLCTGRVLPLFA